LSSKIDAGLELISALGSIELKPIEIRDLLYKLISKNYSTIDKILETAQKEKLLKLTQKTYLMTPKASNLQFEKPKIIKQEESATCRFCKKKLSTGYYVVFKSITYGPYGSSCIRKIYLDYLM
jgi:hypothetical protein